MESVKKNDCDKGNKCQSRNIIGKAKYFVKNGSDSKGIVAAPKCKKLYSKRVH